MGDDTGVWNRVFAREGAVFLEPHEDLPGLAQTLNARRAHRVLDLGCGSGRHVIYLARQGFDVYGLDGAASGIGLTHEALAQAGLAATLRQGDIYAPLPYTDAFFDAVLCVQVAHHATRARISGLVAEIARILAPGGLLFVTVPSLRDQGTRFRAIEPGTFIPLDGREAGLPHHYFTPAELGEVFAAFEITDMHVDSGAHYCLTARRR